MTEAETLLARIAALEARVTLLEYQRAAAPWGMPQPMQPWVVPLQPISPPFLPNGPCPVTCTDGIGNIGVVVGHTYGPTSAAVQA